MKDFFDTFSESWNCLSRKDKILATITTVSLALIVGVLIFYFVAKILPNLLLLSIVGGIIYLGYSQERREREEKARQEEEIRNQERILQLTRKYERIAGKIHHIFKNYENRLGASLSTYSSIYSREKFIYLPGLDEPIFVFSIVSDGSDIELSDIKKIIQMSFIKESLPLYVVKIERDEYPLTKFYLLPITTPNALNWAKTDRKREFFSIRPDKQPERKDRDF